MGQSLRQVLWCLGCLEVTVCTVVAAILNALLCFLGTHLSCTFWGLLKLWLTAVGISPVLEVGLASHRAGGKFIPLETALSQWRMGVASQILQIPCLSEEAFWDWAPAGGNLLIMPPALAASSFSCFPAHLPVFPRITSQIQYVHSQPSSGSASGRTQPKIALWWKNLETFKFCVCGGRAQQRRWCRFWKSEQFFCSGSDPQESAIWYLKWAEEMYSRTQNALWSAGLDSWVSQTSPAHLQNN